MFFGGFFFLLLKRFVELEKKILEVFGTPFCDGLSDFDDEDI